MNTLYYFSLPVSEFPGAVIHAPFEDQYQVWKHLKCEIIDRANHLLFTSHFIPLLAPVIRPYLGRVRAADREDFLQDISLALFRRLPDYNPDYNGKHLLGNVFFKYVVQGEYRSYARKAERYSCALYLEEIPGFTDSFPASASSAEDEAIARIEGRHLLQKYRGMKARYKSGYAAVYHTMQGEQLM